MSQLWLLHTRTEESHFQVKHLTLVPHISPLVKHVLSFIIGFHTSDKCNHLIYLIQNRWILFLKFDTPTYYVFGLNILLFWFQIS